MSATGRPGKAGVKKPPKDQPPPAAAAGQEEDDLPEGQIRPVIIGKRGRRGDTAVQMVTLFELDDVPHQIPRNPSAALVLRWMLDTEEHGQAGAALRMGITLLGKDALDKLAASPEVEVEDLSEIFTAIGEIFFTSDNWRKIQAAPDPS